MKKVMFVLLLFSSVFGFSQCPTGFISLNSQADINNFPVLYPSCTTVNGSLSINDAASNDIVDLSPLSNLTSIIGSLTIMDTDILTSLTGLDNLTSTGSLNLTSNSGLSDISALSNVTSLGMLSVSQNNSLIDLSGLQN